MLVQQYIRKINNNGSKERKKERINSLIVWGRRGVVGMIYIHIYIHIYLLGGVYRSLFFVLYCFFVSLFLFLLLLCTLHLWSRSGSLCKAAAFSFLYWLFEFVVFFWGAFISPFLPPHPPQKKKKKKKIQYAFKLLQ